MRTGQSCYRLTVPQTWYFPQLSMYSYRRLQQFAIAISIASAIYNGAEGGISIGFGTESRSRSLIFFGIQSGIEVISATLVLWRFRKIAKPGDEKSVVLGAEALKFVHHRRRSYTLSYLMFYPDLKSLRRLASASCCWFWRLRPNRAPWPF